jgi:hypothetical protein
MDLKVEGPDIDDLDWQEFELDEHELVVGNIMEYANYLHFFEGYFVFNPEMLKRITQQKLRSHPEDVGELSDETIEGALQTAAAEYVNWLVDIIQETQPPLTPSEATPSTPAGEERDARQGHWADRTGNLAAGFRSQVDNAEVVDHSGVAPDPDPPEDPDHVLDFP